MNTLFASAVTALVPSAAATPVIIWPGKEVPPPNAPFIFAQPHFQCLANQQATLRNINNKRLFTRTALLSIEIFAPKTDAQALVQAEAIGAALEVALCKASPSGNIWFRNARAGTVKGTATQNQVNVVTSCTFQNEQ